MKPQFPLTRSDAEWRRLLNPDQYMVMRRFGTEPAGSCALNHESAKVFSFAPAVIAVVRLQDEIRKQHRLAKLQRPDLRCRGN